MVDENWGKAIEGFCKEVIIMIYHWILTGSEGKEKMGRKIDGRNLWNDAIRVYFNKWIRRRLMGENGLFRFVILYVVSFLIMATSRMWLWEGDGKQERVSKDGWSRNWEFSERKRSSLWLSVWSRARDKQGAGYLEIIGRPHTEKRQVVLPDGIGFKVIGWSWIFIRWSRSTGRNWQWGWRRALTPHLSPELLYFEKISNEPLVRKPHLYGTAGCQLRIQEVEAAFR